MYHVSSKFMQISSIQEVTCVTCMFQVKTLFTSQPFWQSLLPKAPWCPGRTFRCRAQPWQIRKPRYQECWRTSRQGPILFVAGLKKHFLPSQRQEVSKTRVYKGWNANGTRVFFGIIMTSVSRNLRGFVAVAHLYRMISPYTHWSYTWIFQMCV